MTAVEYLLDGIRTLTGLSIAEDEPVVEKAKELEKQQIIDAYNIATKTKYSIAMHKLGISTQPPLVENAEQYYEETFKK